MADECHLTDRVSIGELHIAPVLYDGFLTLINVRANRKLHESGLSTRHRPPLSP
jgi:hypothetical protein